MSLENRVFQKSFRIHDKRNVFYKTNTKQNKMQIRKKQITMNNKLKKHLCTLSRGQHKCSVQKTFLVIVSIKLKNLACPRRH